jgi:hypothetical protein
MQFSPVFCNFPLFMSKDSSQNPILKKILIYVCTPTWETKFYRYTKGMYFYKLKFRMLAMFVNQYNKYFMPNFR